jgi:hypothetical protein
MMVSLLTLRRLWSKVDKHCPNGCWIWTGSENGAGYGELRIEYKKHYAHRLVYEIMKGSIPKGFHLDHLCRTPCCVNPDHLEAVTPRENVIRGISLSAQRAKQTHCKLGHPLAVVRKSGRRGCRICIGAYNKNYGRNE